MVIEARINEYTQFEGHPVYRVKWNVADELKLRPNAIVVSLFLSELMPLTQMIFYHDQTDVLVESSSLPSTISVARAELWIPVLNGSSETALPPCRLIDVHGFTEGDAIKMGRGKICLQSHINIPKVLAEYITGPTLLLSFGPDLAKSREVTTQPEVVLLLATDTPQAISDLLKSHAPALSNVFLERVGQLAAYDLNRALERSRRLSNVTLVFQAASLIVWLLLRFPEALNELRLRLAIGQGFGALRRVALNMCVECSIVIIFSLAIALSLAPASLHATRLLTPISLVSLLIFGLIVSSQCVLLAACAKRFQ